VRNSDLVTGKCGEIVA